VCLVMQTKTSTVVDSTSLAVSGYIRSIDIDSFSIIRIQPSRWKHHASPFLCPVICYLAILFSACCMHDRAQGSFPVRKRTGTVTIWRAREREPIWGSGGGAPSGFQGQNPWSGGQGAKPPEAESILLPKRANLSLSFK